MVESKKTSKNLSLQRKCDCHTKTVVQIEINLMLNNESHCDKNLLQLTKYYCRESIMVNLIRHGENL